MRYATVAPNGKILGVFVCDPELLELRPKPDDAVFIECENANAADWYWDGDEFVTKEPSSIQYIVNNGTVTITNLPQDSIISVTFPDQYKVFETSEEFSILLSEPGGYVFQIDPWPYQKKTFVISIEG
jgi:hypothetical protein